MTWQTTTGQDVVDVNGETVRYYRHRAGSNNSKLTQYQVAKKTGLSRSYIAEIEAGRKQPRRLAAEKLAETLQVHVDELVKSPPEAT